MTRYNIYLCNLRLNTILYYMWFWHADLWIPCDSRSIAVPRIHFHPLHCLTSLSEKSHLVARAWATVQFTPLVEAVQIGFSFLLLAELSCLSLTPNHFILNKLPDVCKAQDWFLSGHIVWVDEQGQLQTEETLPREQVTSHCVLSWRGRKIALENWSQRHRAFCRFYPRTVSSSAGEGLRCYIWLLIITFEHGGVAQFNRISQW